MKPALGRRNSWINRAGQLWFLACSVLALAAMLLGARGAGPSSTTGPSLEKDATQISLDSTEMPFRHAAPAPDSAVRIPARRNIEDVHVAQHVLGRNPDESEVHPRLADPDPATWRKLRLRMLKVNGDDLAIELLRPLEWLSFYEVAVGRTIDLDLSEMGAEGPADVLAVEPCPHIQPGPGNVVTGTFAHRSAGDLINLYVSGEPRPIGITRNHRYWSKDQQAFIAAEQLRIGERLLTGTGHTATVVTVQPRSTDEPVYNLEVHREHLCLVGQLGLLAQNNCGGNIDDLGPGVRDRGRKLGQQQGREFRPDQLGLYEFDASRPKHIRGWLENERRRIAGSGGGPDVPRTPPGYVQAHGRSTPAREGFDYSNSRLQGEDLNKLEEQIRRRVGRR